MKATLAAAVLMFTSCGYSPVLGQDLQCAPLDNVEVGLLENFGETAHSVFSLPPASFPNMAILFYTNEETGTWTQLLLRPEGVVCLWASGEGFTTITKGKDS